MIKPPQMMLLFYITGEVYTKSGIDSIEVLPRHTSTHASVVVIAPGPLMDYLPVSESENSLVADFPVKYLEEMGMFMVSLTLSRRLS